MCGRYSFTEPAEAVRHWFKLPRLTTNLQPRYNIAPTQDAPVVRLDETGERELAMLRWGLVPFWSDGPDSKYSMINARAETVAEEPAFRAAFKARRCLVPATGFFEWRPTNGRKQPYNITLKDAPIMAFAGLWEHWEGDGEVVESFTIIVTQANDALRTLHDRMPVILAPDRYATWLDVAGTTAQEAAEMLVPYAGEVEIYPVSRKVNKPQNDDATVLERADA